MPLDYSDVPSFVLALSGLGALGTLVTCVTRWKVFSFADALGHLADFLGARRDSAWRGSNAHEETSGVPHVSTTERLALYASTIAFQWVAVAVVAWRAKHTDSRPPSWV